MAGKRPSARAIGLMVAIFVLGGVVGGLSAMIVRHVHEIPRRERMIDRLTHELQLTPQQRSQILAIFADAHKRFNAVYEQSQEQVRPQYDAIRQDVHARIRAVLTPDQQAKFNDFLNRLNAEHRIHPPPVPGVGRRGH